MTNKKMIAAITLAFFAGTIITSAPLHSAMAANPTLVDIMTTLTNIQTQLTGIQTTDTAIKAKTDNLPSDPASNTAISSAQSAINSHTDTTVSSAQSAIISTVTSTPKNIGLFLNLATNSLPPFNTCTTVVTADPGKTMIGTMEVIFPAAGSGTSLAVEQSPTPSYAGNILINQKNFNTAENDYDISFTGEILKLCNEGSATANTGIVIISGSAIQLPSS